MDEQGALSLFRQASKVHKLPSSVLNLFSSKDEDYLLNGVCYPEPPSLTDSLLEPVIKG